jgi:hypothetical protein
MAFQLPKESREYFKLLLKRSDGGARFDTLFDLYYFCLMVGLNRKTLSADSDLEADKFIEGYPSDYQNQADVIAGLLINAELSRKGIEKDDRASIEREMLRILDQNSPTRLSEEGMGLLNLYAGTGFRVIREAITPPQNLEEFLVLYYRLWPSEEPSATTA